VNDLRAEAEFYRTERARTEREYLHAVTVPVPYRLALTCEDVPEQWDIFHGERLIGYVRCRHSKWSLRYPDAGGEVLIAEPWHPKIGRAHV